MNGGLSESPSAPPVTPSALRDVTNIHPPAITDILKEIANKPVTSIKLSPTISVD
jgi:hypothetical protein